MRAEIKFEWNEFLSRREGGNILTPFGMPEMYAAIRQFVPTLPDEPEEEWSKTHLADLDGLLELCPGIRLTIVKKIGGKDSIIASIDKLLNAIDKISSSDVFNGRCNVQVPGFGLLAVTELTYLNDACTDEIGRHLDDGWRIVAVCPQPDQRRPDFVLGRNKEKEL